jgi:hypothetical protein
MNAREIRFIVVMGAIIGLILFMAIIGYLTGNWEP